MVAVAYGHYTNPVFQGAFVVECLQLAATSHLAWFEDVDVDFVDEVYHLGTIGCVTVVERFEDGVRFAIEEFGGGQLF